MPTDLVSTARKNPPDSLAGAGREARLLLWLSAAALKHRAGTPAPLDGDDDWREVAALARQHRVAPLIWHNLSRRSDVELPGWLAEEFSAAHRRNALHGLSVASHFIRTVPALAAEGIPALPLKGVCLAARYYDDVAARYAGDIDLLVSPEHVAAAGRVLRGLGYLRSSGKAPVPGKPFVEDPDYQLHSVYMSRDGTPLELHFQLHNNPAVLPIDVAEAVAGGSTVTFGGTALPVMRDDLQFVFLATHGARHEWVRLQWVCDIAFMLDRAGPAEVEEWVATAARYGLINPTVQAMMLAERLLGSALPADIDRKYGRSRRIRYLVRRAEQSMFRGTDGDAEGRSATFDPGRRLYRMCITDRPAYLWHELRNGMRAVSARFARPPAAHP
jgi:hypothetical protein